MTMVPVNVFLLAHHILSNFYYNTFMLELRDVSHLLGWQRKPTPEMQEAAHKYLTGFTRNDSIGMYCAGIAAVARVLNNDYYFQLATALFDAGVARNIPIEAMMPWHVPPEDAHSKFVHSIDDAAKLANTYREQGLRVGLIHGHFRILTPANWKQVLIAREKCDVLFLGVESGWRTEEYKGATPLLDDWSRHHMILASGFDGILFAIKRIPYSDQGYQGMVNKIKPNLYFTSVREPSEMTTKMGRRAAAGGGTLIMLPEQPGPSTSQLIQRGHLTTSM